MYKPLVSLVYIDSSHMTDKYGITYRRKEWKFSTFMSYLKFDRFKVNILHVELYVNDNVWMHLFTLLYCEWQNLSFQCSRIFKIFH